MCGTAYSDDHMFCPVDAAALQPEIETDSLIGTLVADRYAVIDLIGEGGMGRVYRAQHVRLPQQVAIKVLHPNLVGDKTFAERFHREAVNTSQIENEHVARVFDHGTLADGRLFLAMEYVEGERLSDLIGREGHLPVERVVEIIRQVAEALAAAHEQPTPIVHRDLKPENIIIGKSRDGRDKVKVVDFGIAVAVRDGASRLTGTGLVIGTPEYLSPEQLSTTDFDGRSDIYSLAIVVFKTLTGQLPFGGNSFQEVALARVLGRPRTLIDTNVGVHWPPDLQGVLDRGLAQSPADRFAKVQEFADALAKAVNKANASAETAETERPSSPKLNKPVAMIGRRQSASRAVASISLAMVAVSGWLVFRPNDRVATDRDVSRPPVANGKKDTDSTTKRQKNLRTDSIPIIQQGGKDKTPTGGGAAAGPKVLDKGPNATTETKTRASLDSIDALISAAARSDSARSAEIGAMILGRVPGIMARLETRADTVELGLYASQAWLLRENLDEACKIFRAIAREAEEINRLRRTAKFFTDSLNCR
jgi:serine/threonine-protein kinase